MSDTPSAAATSVMADVIIGPNAPLIIILPGPLALGSVSILAGGYIQFRVPASFTCASMSVADDSATAQIQVQAPAGQAGLPGTAGAQGMPGGAGGNGYPGSDCTCLLDLGTVVGNLNVSAQGGPGGAGGPGGPGGGSNAPGGPGGSGGPAGSGTVTIAYAQDSSNVSFSFSTPVTPGGAAGVGGAGNPAGQAGSAGPTATATILLQPY
jgi:hypothetical protein